MVFAVPGFPHNRGGLMTAMLLLFVVISSAATLPAGPQTGQGRRVARNDAAYGVMFPVMSGVSLAGPWFGARSRRAVPFGTPLALWAVAPASGAASGLWGRTLGSSRMPFESRMRTNKDPRQVRLDTLTR
jgi:hypothetical protein